MEEAVAAAHRAGEEIWRRFGVPVYFYERPRALPGACVWKRSAGGNSTAPRPISEILRRIPRQARRWWGRADF